MLAMAAHQAMHGSKQHARAWVLQHKLSCV